jgi:hypothetical protein
MQGSATTAMQRHRRGAVTLQMAMRRRNPKGGRRFATRSLAEQDRAIRGFGNERRMQSAGHDARIHFSAAC